MSIGIKRFLLWICFAGGRVGGGWFLGGSGGGMHLPIQLPIPRQTERKDGANQLRLSYIKPNISQNTHCTSSIYTSVPPPMLSSVLFFHLCST